MKRRIFYLTIIYIKHKSKNISQLIDQGYDLNPISRTYNNLCIHRDLLTNFYSTTTHILKFCLTHTEKKGINTLPIQNVAEKRGIIYPVGFKSRRPHLLPMLTYGSVILSYFYGNPFYTAQFHNYYAGLYSVGFTRSVNSANLRPLNRSLTSGP